MAEFELAIKQAIELIFPFTEFRGHYFHFSQALMKKFQNLSLQIAYRDDPIVNHFLGEQQYWSSMLYSLASQKKQMPHKYMALITLPLL